LTIRLTSPAAQEPAAPTFSRSGPSARRIIAALETPLDDPARTEGFRRVVIIGNGIAGLTAADEMRRRSARADILLLSAEPFPTYNRMAIGKVAEGHKTIGDLSLQTPDWYEEKRISLRLSSRVETIDPRDYRVSLIDGESLAYDRLLIATGARANLPDGGFLACQNCFALRSGSDAAALRRFITAESAKRCVVIGDGILAVETAEGLQRAGLDVTLLMRAKHPLVSLFDDEAATLLSRYLARLGVRVVSPVEVVGATKKGRRRLSIDLANGTTIESDLFIACIGTRPDLALAAEAGCATGRGIMVDQDMRTTLPHVWAAGDVVEFEGQVNGLWPFAVAQGRAAVASMAGIADAYLPPTVPLRLKSDGLDVRHFGTLAAAPGDDIFCAEPFARAWWRAVIRGETVVGAIYIGPAGEPNPLFRAGLPDATQIRQIAGALVGPMLAPVE
jgi:NAD(P)H-nitrite reductase large subunit